MSNLHLFLWFWIIWFAIWVRIVYQITFVFLSLSWERWTQGICFQCIKKWEQNIHNMQKERSLHGTCCHDVDAWRRKTNRMVSLHTYIKCCKWREKITPLHMIEWYYRKASTIYALVWIIHIHSTLIHVKRRANSIKFPNKLNPLFKTNTTNLWGKKSIGWCNTK